jgi:hypothetical protein
LDLIDLEVAVVDLTHVVFGLCEDHNCGKVKDLELVDKLGFRLLHFSKHQLSEMFLGEGLVNCRGLLLICEKEYFVLFHAFFAKK